MQAARLELGLAEEGSDDPWYRGIELNRGQKRLETAVCKQLDRAKRGRLAENEQQWEQAVEEAHANGIPIFATGAPGTGKSFVVDKCVPEADVDTCSGAFFLYKDAIEAMDCLQQYDLVAVDEISQLAQEDFDRIIQMWEAADKIPDRKSVV